MKLKCHHKRRVIIVGPLNSVIHRNDGTRCNDHKPRIGPSVVETRDPSGILMVYNVKGIATRYL